MQTRITETGIRVVMCEKCGGFGGWSVERSFNPFTGSIGYEDVVCPACGGEGQFEAEPMEEDE